MKICINLCKYAKGKQEQRPIFKPILSIAGINQQVREQMGKEQMCRFDIEFQCQ